MTKAADVIPEVAHLGRNDPHYPASLGDHLGTHSPPSITALGNLDILRSRMLAFFSSVKCPGSLILQTHDLAQQWRKNGVVVIGGFHSPMERECLTILLRGTQPVVICPARSIERMRIQAEYKKPLDDGRLLILSPFDQKLRRITAETAFLRNRFVAALAHSIFVTYAEPNSKTDQLCREVVGWRKPLYMLDGNANTNLVALGAKPVDSSTSIGY